MDVSSIMRPNELPFEVPYDLERAINELIDALEREDMALGMYLDEVEGSARMVSEENDDWIRQYYVKWGWRKQQKKAD
jgi:hypothetical protein